MSTTARSLGDAVDLQAQNFVSYGCLSCGYLTRGHQARGQPGDSRLTRFWKDVVGARGERHDGNFPACTSHQSLRPITAKDHNGPRPGRHHLCCAQHRIRRTIFNLHVQEHNLRSLVIWTARRHRTSNSLGDTTSIRNHQDAGNSGHPERRDQPGNDAALFCDRENPSQSDQAPDVTARGWVGYDSNDVFAGGEDLR